MFILVHKPKKLQTKLGLPRYSDGVAKPIHERVDDLKTLRKSTKQSNKLVGEKVVKMQKAFGWAWGFFEILKHTYNFFFGLFARPLITLHTLDDVSSNEQIGSYTRENDFAIDPLQIAIPVIIFG